MVSERPVLMLPQDFLALQVPDPRQFLDSPEPSVSEMTDIRYERLARVVPFEEMDEVSRVTICFWDELLLVYRRRLSGEYDVALDTNE